ncbi:MAG: mechanosensitive ion channel [Desulfuromonadales bacterium]|nr:mechanosensitive ion channel [Desulfuromonadales bacterium]MDT8423665.1 mechanosensitive ion channel [Desulfuromonadales bacterium]
MYRRAPLKRLCQKVPDSLALMGLLLGLVAGAAWSETVPAETPAAAAVTEAALYPGLEEVVPEATTLDGAAVLAQQQIETLRQTTAFSARVEEIRTNWQQENAKIKELGVPIDWPVNRLFNVRAYLEGEERDVVQLLNKIAEPLKVLEELRKSWGDKKDFWQGWEKSLVDSGAKVPKATFRDVHNKIREVLGRVVKASAVLLKLQENTSQINQEIISLKEKIDGELTALKASPFRRNALPLLSSEFFAQFNTELLTKTIAGTKAALHVKSTFFARQGWLLILQALLFVALLVLFRHLAATTADKAEDWQFIFKRRYSAALFISLAAPYLFYVSPPPLLYLGVMLIATISAARLAGELLSEGNQRLLTYTLAALFIVSKIFTTLALPLPLYRLYLSLMAVCGIPFLYWLGRQHRQHVTDGVDRYLALLYSGTMIFLATLTAQIGGFAVFSINLVNSTIGTVFLMLFTLMTLRIAEGAIDLLFSSQALGTTRFVKNLGTHANTRLIRLSRFIIFTIASLYLLAVWGLFSDISAAWLYLMGLELIIGEFHLSIKTIVLIGAVLYFSILLSWFFQSFLESQFFFGKRIDRGVRDAFKKLSHYAIVLVGFIAAMTMAGIELQNFAILAGAFGIGIGFGLQDIVNNFVSGLILLFERPVKVGDAIIIDGQWGTINKIGMRSTVVETWDRSELIVPNSHLISEKVQNWTLSSSLSRVTIKVGVHYGTDMEKVIKILDQIGVGHPAVVDDPAPSAIFTDFGDSSINFELRVWVDDISNRLVVISALGIAIGKAFKKANIEIPYPQRDLHLRSVASDITLSQPPDK